MVNEKRRGFSVPALSFSFSSPPPRRIRLRKKEERIVYRGSRIDGCAREKNGVYTKGRVYELSIGWVKFGRVVIVLHARVGGIHHVGLSVFDGTCPPV